jgi:hypothetical protein
MGKYDNYCRKCGVGLFEGQFRCPICAQREHEKRMSEITGAKRPSGSCMFLLIVPGAALAAISGWILS